MVGSLAGAAISLLKILADPYDQLPAIVFWLLGGGKGLVGLVRGLQPTMIDQVHQSLFGPDVVRETPMASTCRVGLMASAELVNVCARAARPRDCWAGGSR